MRITSLFLAFLLVSCSQGETKKSFAFPDNVKGCFLLYDLQSKKFVQEKGDGCQERLPACSTFKVPLALMAFDSNILKDENEVYKWDKIKKMIPAWNKDHNAQSWMKESVVWFSQKLTPKLGKNKIEQYLRAFDYGNADLSSGLTDAWLHSPNNPGGSLSINAYEQVAFMEKLWTDKLPVSKRALELTKKITYLETSANGYELSGKTGSNFFDKEKKIQLGWFISHIKKNDKEFIAVTTISDLAPVNLDTFGGFRSKELTKQFLAEAGLW